MDILSPFSFAPEHATPSQRRTVPQRPIAQSLPSELSPRTSPLVVREHQHQSWSMVYRGEERGESGGLPEIAAKMPVGMTERECWATKQVELQRDLEEVGERIYVI